MIDDDGIQPILMDLGSLVPSPTPITSRSLALAVQDQAAEHSTMPYRAPELFDVKTGSVIDTKVDIWSLGCTLYACLVGKSPFEMRSDETGGSLSICILGGDWRFPDEGAGGKKKAANQTGQADDSGITESIREVVKACLKVEPSERPDVDQLTEMVERAIDSVSYHLCYIWTGNGAVKKCYKIEPGWRLQPTVYLFMELRQEGQASSDRGERRSLYSARGFLINKYHNSYESTLVCGRLRKFSCG
jgi:serine/threonine kinase 16